MTFLSFPSIINCILKNLYIHITYTLTLAKDREKKGHISWKEGVQFPVQRGKFHKFIIYVALHFKTNLSLKFISYSSFTMLAICICVFIYLSICIICVSLFMFLLSNNGFIWVMCLGCFYSISHSSFLMLINVFDSGKSSKYSYEFHREIVKRSG